jgi:hypothetical protein
MFSISVLITGSEIGGLAEWSLRTSGEQVVIGFGADTGILK